MHTATETMAKLSVQQRQEGQHYQLEGAQACEYNSFCSFTWTISNVHEKKTTATSDLHSPAFYTGPKCGYKACLFLYMNGDGCGKGTHISFFFALMRGEYDALLPWSFKQKVTLMLVDQSDNEQGRHIAKSFQPAAVDPMHASFESYLRPSLYTEMNVAIGFPKFAPLSILENPSYIKNDTMVLRCIVDTTGIN